MLAIRTRKQTGHVYGKKPPHRTLSLADRINVLSLDFTFFSSSFIRPQQNNGKWPSTNQKQKRKPAKQQHIFGLFQECSCSLIEFTFDSTLLFCIQSALVLWSCMNFLYFFFWLSDAHKKPSHFQVIKTIDCQNIRAGIQNWAQSRINVSAFRNGTACRQ